MKLPLLLLATVTLVNAEVPNKNVCKGIPINGIDHTKVIIKDNVDKPSQLTINHNTKTIYFSYSDGDVLKMAHLNLETNEFGTFAGINGPAASTVHSESYNVYFGGSDGIYKLFPNSVVKTFITEDNVKQLFSKDFSLYFTTSNEEAFEYLSFMGLEKVKQIGSAKAQLIAVDNRDNIIYSNSNGLFIYEDRSKEIKTLGNYTVNGFAADSNGKIFFSTPTGIYKILGKAHKVKELAKINDVYGLAIESDGTIIYGSQNSIVRLKSTGKVCSAD